MPADKSLNRLTIVNFNKQTRISVKETVFCCEYRDKIFQSHFSYFSQAYLLPIGKNKLYRPQRYFYRIIAFFRLKIIILNVFLLASLFLNKMNILIYCSIPANSLAALPIYHQTFVIKTSTPLTTWELKEDPPPNVNLCPS